MLKNKKKNNFGFILTIFDYLNPFAGIHELFLVIRYYYVLRKTMHSDEAKKLIKDNNETKDSNKCRVDNLGRLYTVVNLPIEQIEKEDVMALLTIDALRVMDKMLLQLGVTDFVTPDIERHYNPDKDAYYILIVIGPNTSFFTIRNIIWELIKITLIIIGLIIII